MEGKGSAILWCKPVLMGCNPHKCFSVCLVGSPLYERGRSVQAALGICLQGRTEGLELGILFHHIEGWKGLELCIPFSLLVCLWLNSSLVPNWERSMSRLYIVTLLIYLTCKMPGWIKQAGIKIAGRHINNLKYADDTPLMAQSEEKLKRLFMKVK